MKNKKLHNIKKTGFKVPDNYFESLESNIFDKLKNEDTIENIQDTGYETPDSYFESIEESVLDKLNSDISLDNINQTGFNTPTDYFDAIEDTVFANFNEDKVVPLFSRRNILYISGIAAAIMIMLGVFMNKEDDFTEDMDMDLVEIYLEQQDIDTYDIASLLTEEDFTEDNFGIINDNFSEESLEDYLMDNANLEDIIEQ